MARAGLAYQINDIPSSAYPTPAQNPLNSRLDYAALQAAFSIKSPDWRASLDKILQELQE